MNRILLIFLAIGGAWYVWWRFRRGFAAVAEAFRDEPPKSMPRKTAQPKPAEKQGEETLTLEKDPKTGVYRPRKG